MILFLVLFQIIGIAHAIGISPSAMELTYAQGQELRLKFIAVNSMGVPVLAEVYIEGELANYAFPEKIKIVLKPREAKEFYVRLKMPDFLEPGTHNVQIGVIEGTNSKGNMLSARAGVKSNIVVSVPFVGKYLKAELGANTVNVGEPVQFDIFVRNLGAETIGKVSAVVSIFDGQKKLGFADSDTITNIAMLKSTHLSASWPATQGGEFTAVADVFYDELSAKVETKFKVGSFLVSIVDIVYGEILAGAIGKITVSMQSNWNSEINGAFTELFVSKDGVLVAKVTGKPFSLKPWGNYAEDIFWDTTGHPPGIYDGRIALHYADKISEQSFRIGLTTAKTFDSNIYVAIVILLVSLFVLSMMYSRVKRR